MWWFFFFFFFKNLFYDVDTRRPLRIGLCTRTLRIIMDYIIYDRREKETAGTFSSQSVLLRLGHAASSKTAWRAGQHSPTERVLVYSSMVQNSTTAIIVRIAIDIPVLCIHITAVDPIGIFFFDVLIANATISAGSQFSSLLSIILLLSIGLTVIIVQLVIINCPCVCIYNNTDQNAMTLHPL